ncbi:MAG: DUF4870 domain-containing protein [Anaerolineales bacterium]
MTSDQEKRSNAAPDVPSFEMDAQPAPSHDDEMIPVKVRETIQASMRQARADAEEQERIANEPPHLERLIAEQEARLAGDDVSNVMPNAQRRALTINTSRRRLRRPAPENLNDNERSWAMLAHASAILTGLIGLSTGGLGALLTLFIPLGIYLYYRDQSDFVAHHALQAFAVQIVGVVGFVALLVSVFVIWVVLLLVAALLSAVLIGIPLLILLLLAAPFLLLGTLLLPAAMLVYSIMAAVEAWGGRFYSYPWIGDWVDNQIYTDTSTI